MKTLTVNLNQSIIKRISNLSGGDLAILRRCNHNPLESEKLFPVLGKLGFLNSPTNSIIACLYAAYHGQDDLPYFQPKFNFGEAFQKAYNPEHSKDKDIRFRSLLSTTDWDQLAYRLRQAVKLLKSKSVLIDFSILLRDLNSWNSENRWVQREWAKGYYPSQDISPDNSNPEDNTASDEDEEENDSFL